MLETTRATRFLPGSNVKGEVVGASWRFLLPTLRHGRIVSFGRLGQATLAGLEAACEELIVVEEGTTAAVPDGSADVILVQSSGVSSHELRRIVAPAGSVFSESPLVAGALTVWLSPPGGEIGAMAPLDDRRTVDFLIDHGKLDPAMRRLTPSRVKQWAREHPAVAALRRRRGFLAGPSSTGEPPGYLRPLVHAGGLDPASTRWGISVPGQYSSKKVLIFLFGREDPAPTAIVKLTRAPAFNGRLENEYEALRNLAERRVGAPGAIPRALALEHAGELVLVAESAVDGVPFRLRSSGRASCPLLACVETLLLDLSAETVAHDHVTPQAAAAILGGLLDQLVAIYRISPAHEAFLRRQLATVAGCRGPFPVVFQHGDPGIWNVLVTPSGDVVLLDWEAAEAQGVPLWDLFYFARSYGSLRPAARGTQRDFLGDSDLVTWLVRAVQAHRVATGLPVELVEPLFYTCWLHRALKEATRRPPDRLDDGHFVSLLRRVIDGRASPALASLFSLGR